MNIIEFEEDTRSRRFHARVTDRAIESVSNPLSYFLAQSMGVQPKRVRQVHTMPGTVIDTSQPILPGLVIRGEGEDEQEDLDVAPLEARKALSAGTEATQLQEIFRTTNDNKLILRNPRLKQNSKRDFVMRLSVLFLYAREQMGHETVSRAELRELLSSAKVYDSNARTSLANTDLLSHDGDSFGLSVPGRERAQEILRQVYDPNIENTWTLGSRPSGHTRKAVKRESENTEEAGSKQSRGNRAKGASYTAQVRKLVDEDFFKEGRTSEEVKAGLERRGHRFEKRRIAQALLTFTQNGRLSRDQNETSDWVYQNK